MEADIVFVTGSPLERATRWAGGLNGRSATSGGNVWTWKACNSLIFTVLYWIFVGVCSIFGNLEVWSRLSFVGCWPCFWWTRFFLKMLAAEAQVLNSLPPTHKLTDRIQYYVGPTTSRCPEGHSCWRIEGFPNFVALVVCLEGLGLRVCICRC